MSETPMQQDIFGGETPMAAEAPVEPVVVWRQPGWYLVASNSTKPQRWHQLRTASTRGAVVTRCGMNGRVVHEESPQMVLCPVCEELP